MTKIISIVNQKGGTGKSACTANYGVGLAQMKKKVLVVDVDPQFDLSASLGFRDCDESNETLTEAITGSFLLISFGICLFLIRFLMLYFLHSL